HDPTRAIRRVPDRMGEAPGDSFEVHEDAVPTLLPQPGDRVREEVLVGHRVWSLGCHLKQFVGKRPVGLRTVLTFGDGGHGAAGDLFDSEVAVDTVLKYALARLQPEPDTIEMHRDLIRLEGH